MDGSAPQEPPVQTIEVRVDASWLNVVFPLTRGRQCGIPGCDSHAHWETGMCEAFTDAVRSGRERSRE